ncbi:CASP-like protein 3A1 [Camellia lanceoleosa]|uniref:CASP-like protein 3A1 n=1 Tax=Camellia lanceoleosa TaxID=1840588 RepID=A0ACC0HX49_9ERIC|nr:CASP-like protein 3A1 [Camellia lanceoleosa]
MMNGKKTLAEAATQLPETKVAAAAEESGTNSGSLESARRKLELTHIVLRLACLSTAVASLSLMATAEEASTVSIYGFSLPVYSKWSFADSFVYLVGVSAAAAAHSVVQFLISTSRLLHKSPVIPSRSHAWIIFAGDQAFAYAMMSAGSAASGVTNLNRTGIKHSALPNFCKPLHSFCDRVAVSIAFTFVSCGLLTASIVVDVIWLSKC